MRKIAVMEDFLTPERRKKVLDTAEKCGFAVDFYGRGAAPAQGLEQYEIIYGWCNPQDLKRATGLKWYCCGFAGVDQLSDDSLYASPDVVLSNSSGAYGLTISEHILMVTLMLLRREWVSELPMRSIYGSRITVLGAGDIGTNFARRAKALGAGHICGVSRSGRNPDPAYDRMLPQEQLDQVLPETEILVMALPSVADTVGILSRERIALLPRDAIVVNVGGPDGGPERRAHRRGGPGRGGAGAAAQGAPPVEYPEPAADAPHFGEYVLGLHLRHQRGHVLPGSGKLRRRPSPGAPGGPEAGLLKACPKRLAS